MKKFGFRVSVFGFAIVALAVIAAVAVVVLYMFGDHTPFDTFFNSPYMLSYPAAVGVGGFMFIVGSIIETNARS